MIEEFTDVNSGEKLLMKLWNLHMLKKGYLFKLKLLNSNFFSALCYNTVNCHV